jgi:SAM-dependent methyltransferase
MEKPEYTAMYSVEDTHWWFRARKLFVASALSRLFPATTRRILIDIGAGTGGMIGFLSGYGKVIGIEPSVFGRRYAKKRGYLLKKGTAEQTGVPARSADVVCFFDVLYHQGINDTKALRHARSLLKPGGMLIITDCAMPFLAGPHDRAVQGRERYVLGELVQKVEKAGFVIVKRSSLFFLLFPVIFAKRMIDRYRHRKDSGHSDVTPVSGWINTLCFAICRLEAQGLRKLSYPWGSSLLIVAKKS